MIEYRVTVGEYGEEHGDIRYYNKDRQLHRENGPAVEYTAGTHKGCKCWKINGRTHRDDGPAIIAATGRLYYCLHGKYFRSKEAWQAELDRQNKPKVVKMTVAEIAAKLGHEVEVVRG